MEIKLSQKAEILFQKYNININGNLVENSENTLINASIEIHAQTNVKRVINEALFDLDLIQLLEEPQQEVKCIKSNNFPKNELKKIYFDKWKQKMKSTNANSAASETETPDTAVNEEKITVFLENVQKNLKTKVPITKIENNKISNKSSKENKSECFKNRFETQKDIILMQKCKLLEQEQQIEELKYGKASEKLCESVQKAKSDLNDIVKRLGKSSKLVAKILQPEDPKEVEMRINKVPKMVRQMEQRAKEREEKRRLIQERKRIIEEEKKRLAEELVEKKRAQDEEERKANLAQMKERRRKELELEMKRKEERRIDVERCQNADNYYRKKLKKKSLKAFKLFLYMRSNDLYLSQIFFETKILKQTFQIWKLNTKKSLEEKINIADKYYNEKISLKVFEAFKMVITKKQQNYYVAVDYYNFHLQLRCFEAFYLFANAAKVRRCRLMQTAIRHFNTRLLIQYFYQWKSLPAVLKLERAKEEKKRRWRQKVLEVIPDYKPPELL